jgi:hypothetical protein
MQVLKSKTHWILIWIQESHINADPDPNTDAG